MQESWLFTPCLSSDLSEESEELSWKTCTLYFPRIKGKSISQTEYFCPFPKKICDAISGPRSLFSYSPGLPKAKSEKSLMIEWERKFVRNVPQVFGNPGQRWNAHSWRWKHNSTWNIGGIGNNEKKNRQKVNLTPGENLYVRIQNPNAQPFECWCAIRIKV